MCDFFFVFFLCGCVLLFNYFFFLQKSLSTNESCVVALKRYGNSQFFFVLLEFVSARGQFIFTDFFSWQPDCVSLCVCFSVGFCYCLLFSVCFAHIYKIYLNLLD